MIVGEVLDRHSPAGGIDRLDDLLRDRPRVETRSALGGDRLERCGEIVERDVIAGLRNASIRAQIDPSRRRVAGKRLRRQRQGVGDVVVDCETLPRERDRRRDKVSESEFARAIFAPGELEAGHGPRNSGREAGIARPEWIGLAVGVEEHVFGRRCGRGFAVVDGDRLVEIGPINQHEAAAAEVAGARHGDGERESDGDRRIDGVAPAFQDVQPDARGRCFLTDDHAMPGDHRACGGEGRDEWVGDNRGRSEAKKSEHGELERPQSVVLKTWMTRS